MSILLLNTRARDKFAGLQTIFSLFKRRLALCTGALLLTFTGNAFALDITVGLAILNDIDSNGNITVVNGGKVKVAFEVTGPDAKMTSKADKIQLLRVDDDSVVSSVGRGKKKSGTVMLPAKKSENEALYVRYLRKGESDPSATNSHPTSPGYVPLVSIPKASLDSLAIRVNAAETDTALDELAARVNAVETDTALDDLADRVSAVETDTTVMGDQNLRMLQGTIHPDGSVIAGAGYSVVKNDTGDYTITFDTAFAGFPAMSYSTNFFPNFVVSNILTFGSASVLVKNASGTTVDPNAWFSFIAVGPR